MTIKIHIFQAEASEMMEFPSMKEATEYINSHPSEDRDYFIQIHPAVDGKQVCPNCGKNTLRYYYSIDSMCCTECGYLSNGGIV